MAGYSGRTWQLVKQGDARDITLFGMPICREHWTRTGRLANVINPKTGRMESAEVYKIVVNGDILQNFATLDLGGNEVAFYL